MPLCCASRLAVPSLSPSFYLSHTLRLLYCHLTVWPHLAKFRHLGKLFSVRQNFKPTLAIFIHFGQIWAAVNSQIMKNNLAIWSHCRRSQLKKIGLPKCMTLTFSNFDDFFHIILVIFPWVVVYLFNLPLDRVTLCLSFCEFRFYFIVSFQLLCNC